MNTVNKYENIENELPKLPKVLLNTIQSSVLKIKKVDKMCDKYLNTCSTIPELQDAHYVVYSNYMDKSHHKYEKFIFLDKDGAEIRDVSGVLMDLYGLLTCTNLCLSEEYKAKISDKE